MPVSKTEPGALRDCPFCGDEARLHQCANYAMYPEFRWETWVQCCSCGAQTGVCHYAEPNHAAAIDRWNTRFQK